MHRVAMYEGMKSYSQTVVEKQLRFDSENILAQLIHEFQRRRE